MKNLHLTHAKHAKAAKPALNGTKTADNAGFACVRCKTEREVLDAVRLVFPNAKYVRREPPLDLVAKECLVCGRVYYGRSESQYCGNKCASVGHRQYKNPRRTRIQSLREQCRLSWQRALSDSDAKPETFEDWLHRFEKRIGKQEEQTVVSNDPNTDPLVIEAQRMKAFSDFVHSHRDPDYRRKRLRTWPDDPEAERIARLMLDSRQEFLVRLIRRAVKDELDDRIREQHRKERPWDFPGNF